MAQKHWDGQGPNGEKVYLDEKELIVVESGDEKVRLGCWCKTHQKRQDGGILAQGIENLERQLGPYLYLHVEIPEADRKEEKGKKRRWAHYAEAPPPFCAWPENLQMSVAQWILSATGPEDLVSQITVSEVSTRHVFLSGFFILLNVPEGLEL